jgi:hypothetical protein
LAQPINLSGTTVIDSSSVDTMIHNAKKKPSYYLSTIGRIGSAGVLAVKNVMQLEDICFFL